MNLFNKLDRYLLDDDYKITIKKDIIHIINYQEVEDFSNQKIIIKHNQGRTILTGTNLTITKMELNELIITGKIQTIEYN